MVIWRCGVTFVSVRKRAPFTQEDDVTQVLRAAKGSRFWSLKDSNTWQYSISDYSDAVILILPHGMGVVDTRPPSQATIKRGRLMLLLWNPSHRYNWVSTIKLCRVSDESALMGMAERMNRAYLKDDEGWDRNPPSRIKLGDSIPLRGGNSDRGGAEYHFHGPISGGNFSVGENAFQQVTVNGVDVSSLSSLLTLVTGALPSLELERKARDNVEDVAVEVLGEIQLPRPDQSKLGAALKKIRLLLTSAGNQALVTVLSATIDYELAKLGIPPVRLQQDKRSADSQSSAPVAGGADSIIIQRTIHYSDRRVADFKWTSTQIV